MVDIIEKIRHANIPVDTGLLVCLSIEYQEFNKYLQGVSIGSILSKLADAQIITQSIDDDGDRVYISPFKKTDPDAIDNLTKSLRKLWQDTIKGRSSTKVDISMSISEFLINNPEYIGKEEDIFKAGQKYINSLTNPQYVVNLKKFISNGVVEDYLEEVDDDPTDFSFYD